MKVTIVNGSAHRGSTWHCADAIMKELEKYGEVERTEFFLPNDMPHFCNGCFSCFFHGEHTCPHAASVQPIVQAITGCDLVVLTSPVYGMDVSGQMKALLDHLCYMWMSHRPNPRMFGKAGLIVTTTAGAGLGHTAKTMKNSLTFWGVKKVFPCRFAIAAMKWSDVSEKKRKKIQGKAESIARRIARSVQNPSGTRNPLFRSFIFKMMAGMQKKNDWNQTDRAHWEANGWLAGGKPF